MHFRCMSLIFVFFELQSFWKFLLIYYRIKRVIEDGCAPPAGCGTPIQDGSHEQTTILRSRQTGRKGLTGIQVAWIKQTRPCLGGRSEDTENVPFILTLHFELTCTVSVVRIKQAFPFSQNLGFLAFFWSPTL